MVERPYFRELGFTRNIGGEEILSREVVIKRGRRFYWIRIGTPQFIEDLALQPQTPESLSKPPVYPMEKLSPIEEVRNHLDSEPFEEIFPYIIDLGTKPPPRFGMVRLEGLLGNFDR